MAPSAEAGRIAQLEQEVAALTSAFSTLQSRIERLESSLS
jgi:ubiquinone biosynthesis protein UbiJ